MKTRTDRWLVAACLVSLAHPAAAVPCSAAPPPPCTISCPQTIVVAAAADACGMIVNYPYPVTSGQCGSVTCSPPSGTFFPIGTTTVVCTTASGASCTFRVGVRDVTPPSVVCPANIYAQTPSQSGAPIPYPAPTVTDTCGAGVTCSPPSGTFFPIGTTTVTCTATDVVGNTATCSFTITLSVGPPCEDLVQFSSVSYGTKETTSTANVTLTRSGDCASPVTVHYATSDNTAEAGSDYAGTSGSVTFYYGETSKSVAIPILDDADPDGDESFNVLLSSPVNGALGGRNRATVTIADDEGTAMLGFTAHTIQENEFNHDLSVTVKRTGTTAGTVSVDYAVASNTATLGVDAVATPGTLTFGPGETEKSFTVSIIGDSIAELNETLFLTLSNPVGAKLNPRWPRAVLVIDEGSPLQGFYLSTVFVTEGGTVAAKVVRVSDTTVQSVTLTTSDATAVAGSDYTPVSTVVTFAVGETLKDVPIPTSDDQLVEGTEWINVTLSNPTNGGTVAAQGQSLIWLQDNDDYGELEFGYAAYQKDEAGRTITLTVTRSGGATGTVTVNYATSSNTALEGWDYVAASNTLTFAPGETSKTIVITLLDDALNEGAESFNVVLSNPTGGARLRPRYRAVAHILDDDQ